LNTWKLNFEHILETRLRPCKACNDFVVLFLIKSLILI
jgi:hypothetical protein